MAAKETSFRRWFHNGSTVSVKAENGTIEIRYDIPRTGMRMVGAKKSDLLFLGRTDENRIWGTAFIFNKACGPHPYKVDGNIDEGAGIIIISGEAPILSSRCDTLKSRKDKLEFIRTDK
ncbi:MAG: hypothetical protein OEL76_15655 [Siculibacillus sp.]|nr:hypothetical protein [Siculibacillus sp.]